MDDAAAIFYFAFIAACLLAMCGLAWVLQRMGFDR